MMFLNNNLTKYLLITLLVMGTSSDFCFAKTRDDDAKEKKEFTQAEKLDPEKLNIQKDRAYDEGVMIKEINITGNSLVSKEKILSEAKLKPGARFNRQLIKDGLKDIYDMGYFTERIKAVPEADPSGITLHIQVEENVPVAGFNISGNDIVKSQEIMTKLETQIGLPQNLTRLNKSIKEIEKMYAEKGFILARIKKVQDDPDGVINVEINEGVIDEIEISGNVKTKEFVITRNLTVKPGEVYNELKLKKDLGRVFATQAFSDVRRVLSASLNDPSKYKLTVEVDEKRTGSISLGGGVDTETGLFGQTGYTDHNFLGRGQELDLNLLVGSGIRWDANDVVDEKAYQVELKFVEPRLFQSLTSLQVNAYGRDLASYQVPLAIERRIGGKIELTRPIEKVPHLAGRISLGVEDVNVKEGDLDEITKLFGQKQIDISERAKQLEGGTFLSLGPGLVYDTRNKLLNTTEGWYASADFKESFALSGSSETFGKANAKVRKFIPIGEKSTVVLSGKVGSNVLGDLPEFASFRLGGPYTVRGFREGDVGIGNGFAMASAEIRTPIPLINKLLKYKFVKDMRLAFFADAGRLFEERVTNQLYDYPGYAVSIGTGVILPLPFLGPLRFDYGYPITKVGAGNKRGRFSFGVGDRY